MEPQRSQQAYFAAATRQPRILFFMGVALLTIACPRGGSAVTQPPIRVTPSCSAAGDSVLVEVNFLPRVYHRNVIHRVYLDWTGALSQPFFSENVPTWTQQWSKRVRIPPGTASGTHSIRFEQLELIDPPTVGFERTACSNYLNFTVADTASANPWRDSLYTETYPSNRPGLLLYFDPTGICGIPKCDTIQLVQVIHASGTDTLGGVRNLSYADQRFPEASRMDAERTAAGWRVDVTFDAKNPFYTTSAPIGTWLGTPGRSGDTVVVAFMRDAPQRHTIVYPPDIRTITLDYEVCAVCTHGEGKGAFLGRYLWRWVQERGTLATLTFIGGSRDAPSATFGDALEQWRSKHKKFKLPVTKFPVVGGTPCP